ncbi:elongation factor 4, partial [Candidatus Microgenomates bacterium]|nr:elongation factor 4 [Candidatus Microgenomates bacterium]
LKNYVTLSYELPLAEIITDFFDQLKSASSGFASIDYTLLEYRPFVSAKLDILINHESVDAFSQIMEKSKAEKFGRFLVERLKEVIPRQQIPVPIQAAIDGAIIARADIPAFRKDVTAKLYGGDVTRRMKLLEKQKKGKEKMKQIGKVSIPGDTFLKIFRT